MSGAGRSFVPRVALLSRPVLPSAATCSQDANLHPPPLPSLFPRCSLLGMYIQSCWPLSTLSIDLLGIRRFIHPLPTSRRQTRDSFPSSPRSGQVPPGPPRLPMPGVFAHHVGTCVISRAIATRGASTATARHVMVWTIVSVSLGSPRRDSLGRRAPWPWDWPDGHRCGL